MTAASSAASPRGFGRIRDTHLTRPASYRRVAVRAAAAATVKSGGFETNAYAKTTFRTLNEQALLPASPLETRANLDRVSFGT